MFVVDNGASYDSIGICKDHVYGTNVANATKAEKACIAGVSGKDIETTWYGHCYGRACRLRCQ